MKNKIMAIGLIAIGLLATVYLGDATFLVLTLIVGTFLFLTKTNWVC